MYNKLKNKKNERYLFKIAPFIIFSIIIILMHIKVQLFPWGDDQYFYNVLNNYTAFEFIKERYMNITGRIIPEFFLIHIIRMNLWVWRIINISLCILAVNSIYKLAINNKEEKINKNELITKTFIYFSFFLIYFRVIEQGVLWVVGSTNYIWTMALTLFAIIPFKQAFMKENINKKLYICYILAAIYACYFEQTSLVLICFGIIMIIAIYVKDKKINKFLIIHYIFIVINSLMLFCAPGFGKRTQVEIKANYINYDMLKFIDKIFLCFNHLLDHLMNKSLIIFVILILSMVIIYSRFKHKLIRALLLLLNSIFVIKILLANNNFYSMLNNGQLNNDPNNFIFNFYKINIDNLTDIKVYIPIIIGTLIVILIPLVLYLVFGNTKKSFLNILIYLAAIASTMALSISPSIYASAERIFLLTDLLLLVNIANLAVEVKKVNLKVDKYFLGGICLFLIFAIVNFGLYKIY